MNDWLHICNLQDIPAQGARVLETTFGDIAIFRNQADEVFALRDRCPHKGGPLSQGIVHGKRVACPLHNWIIELESGEAMAPDVGCAQRFDVKIEQGEIDLGLTVAAGCSKAA